MNSYGILLLISLAQIVDYGLLPTNEARPPHQLLGSITIQCGSSTLVVNGFGLARPIGAAHCQLERTPGHGRCGRTAHDRLIRPEHRLSA